MAASWRRQRTSMRTSSQIFRATLNPVRGQLPGWRACTQCSAQCSRHDSHIVTCADFHACALSPVEFHCKFHTCAVRRDISTPPLAVVALCKLLMRCSQCYRDAALPLHTPLRNEAMVQPTVCCSHTTASHHWCADLADLLFKIARRGCTSASTTRSRRSMHALRRAWPRIIAKMIGHGRRAPCASARYVRGRCWKRSLARRASQQRRRKQRSDIPRTCGHPSTWCLQAAGSAPRCQLPLRPLQGRREVSWWRAGCRNRVPALGGWTSSACPPSNSRHDGIRRIEGSTETCRRLSPYSGAAYSGYSAVSA